ncbi:uncharacterized protein Z520_09960 [Fonsecaea multimorphosa CBS 102226]|uniref:FAD-binding domain-containing protein n=1 Tax=Fonsecaea multimorphosa CBS 102226 TaxID=1442371 RepID=A0A0D2GXF4_9EURO|nr:uncharacterized protein Z520_09960 [Fonsecaea multimorphosa CBS 102226]KIX94250.1 hypothetical protein Z520_09960 [Fonsecaea multimorphosa CBS 102226]OAL19932.1 hypothetical protein AYO22_09459 [Fonsecaea multimorphosa]
MATEPTEQATNSTIPLEPDADFVQGQTAGAPAKPVLVIGGGVVGCLTALKLGQAGIDVDIIERLPQTSNEPRACGYYGAVHHMLNDIGMYKVIREEGGFMTRGLCFRKPPKDDGQGRGGKVFGDVVANLPLCGPNDPLTEPGAGLLNMPQAQLNRLFLREALKTGHVQIHFNRELVRILKNDDHEKGVTVLTRDPNTGAEREFKARYAVAADGAHSAARKALGLPYAGHTWPERLIATNVMVRNVEETPMHTHFVMHPTHFSISTPLQDPVMGEKTLWRWTLAADPALEQCSDEELLTDEVIHAHYARCVPGPRPLDVDIVARSVYRTHQRLVPTMRKGNVLLAGDAAHCNHPFGALGLNTGMLDAEACADALIMILRDSFPAAHTLNTYSDSRRKVFQFFVDPTSTQNKLRVHSNPVETAAEDDWYLRDLNHMTPKKAVEMARPYFEGWRTDMRKAVVQEMEDGFPAQG